MSLRSLLVDEEGKSTANKSALLLVVALVLGIGVGFGRAEVAWSMAKKPKKLEFLSPYLKRGKIYGEFFVGDFDQERWKGLTREAKEQEANTLANRLLDTHHVPAAVIFCGDRTVVQIARAEARVLND